ncbi:MAG: LLM class flavin-dependent oxidoreductase, partial [Pseudomonadota bacterium]
MKIGAVFPHQEIGEDPVVIRDWAQAAEEIGYSHLLVYDHVLGAVHENREPKLWGPYNEHDDFHEPFVLFGYFASCTQRVELVTGVLILPQRQTSLVAKQAAQIDLLSGGRLRLGVGTGWNYVEYDSLNEDFANRGKRQEEQIELMRKLCTAGRVDFR